MSIFFPEDEGREVPEVDYQPILRTELVTGAAGPTGSQGQKGDTGATGAGVVTGGLTGQVLAKKSNTDYDTEWVTGGGGGSAIWGGIAGTLSNQTDLQTVLDAKAPSSGISPSAISGTAVITTDSRLSDSRTPTGAASGDLSGTYPAPEVIKLRGYSVSLNSPSDNQAILFNSSATAFQNSTLTIGTISGLSADLSGKITSVGATSPVVSSGGTTPTISIPVATAATSGYISSTDWSTFNSKQAGGTYVTSVTGTTPIVSSGGTTPAISIPAATATTSGYISSADWTTFNEKAKTTDVQIFTTSGTWTKPAGAKSVDVNIIGGGGGGSSGRVNAGQAGGGGGAGGNVTNRAGIPASILGSTETVTVGAGGTGGAGTNIANAQNTFGTNGGNSSFGATPWVIASGGSGAATNNGAAGFYGARGFFFGGQGGSGGGQATPSVGVVGTGAQIGAGGGGGGGSCSTAGQFFAGGNGFPSLGYQASGGQALGGATAGAAGANGNGINAVIGAGGGGGGGAGNATGNAGAGGNGSVYGGGGGGGGCCGWIPGTSGQTYSSGAGGNGGQGVVIVTTYF